MRRLAAALAVTSALPFQLSAQDHSRALARISLALQQPPPVLVTADPQEAIRASTRQARGASIFEPLPGAPKLGPLALGTPQLRGEIIRLSLPVGDYLSRGARALAATNRRRQETAARRQVEADLQAFARLPRP